MTEAGIRRAVYPSPSLFCISVGRWMVTVDLGKTVPDIEFWSSTVKGISGPMRERGMADMSTEDRTARLLLNCICATLPNHHHKLIF